MLKIPIYFLDVYKEKRRLAKELHGIGPFIKGSMVELGHSYGKKHPANYLSLSVSGKTSLPFS